MARETLKLYEGQSAIIIIEGAKLIIEKSLSHYTLETPIITPKIFNDEVYLKQS